MGKKETPLEKIANISQLVGIIIITINILGGIFPNLRLYDLEYLVGGFGIGVLFAWVFPFFIRRWMTGRLW